MSSLTWANCHGASAGIGTRRTLLWSAPVVSDRCRACSSRSQVARWATRTAACLTWLFSSRSQQDGPPKPMPEIRLDAADAAELAEMLQFLIGWLARDPARLAISLE